MDESPPISNGHSLRVAVEGCGHGTLDAIYASIQKSYEIKGWDGVDLVIICGDFQAVRDRLDLNVTAMPAKYREMADFHQYYWGNKHAPYLTIFIGGNHEASNHLWELYYGGWVAPNIYYLGAANVIRFGPLKIAGLSGIWKGYDYRKPHYERLPYNNDDMYSIYHVRELDARKLLAYRSQVDIGLSHDWPHGIEWLGNSRQLFKKKEFLREDAESGRLGNIAAEQVLDQLRPAYWFSAHLHTRYTAVKQFQKHPEADESAVASYDESLVTEHKASRNEVTTVGRFESIDTSQDQAKVSAWQNFHIAAKANEEKENAQKLEEKRARHEDGKGKDLLPASGNVYNELYKKVKLADGFSRAVTSVTQSIYRPEDKVDGLDTKEVDISQLDGCCSSVPVKRRRSSDSGQPTLAGVANVAYTPLNTGGLRDIANESAKIINPDAIDIDSSDDDDAAPTFTNDMSTHDVRNNTSSSTTGPDHRSNSVDRAGNSVVITSSGDRVSHTREDPPSIVLDVTTDPRSDAGNEKRASNSNVQAPVASNSVIPNGDAKDTDIVSEEMRAQLAALSTKFAEKKAVNQKLSLPNDINNTTTRFLALSKCVPGHQFLQLIEIKPLQESAGTERLLPRLQYDPEWLAILRVFAPELTLGGNPSDPTPRHQGDVYYRDRVIEEEKWVHEHIVEKNLLEVPLNFEVTLPPPDPTTNVDQIDMPLEATNPQTTAFCNLIGIENKFDFDDDDRKGRRSAGPRPSHRQDRSHNNPRGGWNSRGGPSGNQHRGGRGRGRGSGFRGRSRGRGQ